MCMYININNIATDDGLEICKMHAYLQCYSKDINTE